MQGAPGQDEFVLCLLTHEVDDGVEHAAPARVGEVDATKREPVRDNEEAAVVGMTVTDELPHTLQEAGHIKPRAEGGQEGTHDHVERVGRAVRQRHVPARVGLQAVDRRLVEGGVVAGNEADALWADPMVANDPADLP
jgi:hypothetical protein